MAHVASRATVVVNNPHAEGYLSKFAFQRDWRHESRKQDEETYGGGRGQFTIHKDTEWLDALHCLKPRGWLPAGDMTGLWAIDAGGGDWRVTSPAVLSPRSVWADYYQSGPQQWGSLTSANALSTNLGVGIIRDALPDDMADYPRYVAVTFLGDAAREGSRTVGFVFPYGMKSAPHPYVLDKLASAAGEGTVAAYWDMGGGHSVKLDDDSHVEFLFFEVIDDTMVVRHSKHEKAFVFRPYDRHNPAEASLRAFAPGTMRLTVYGHAAMLYCGGLLYPASSSALAQPYQYLDDTLYSDNNDPAYTSWHVHTWGAVTSPGYGADPLWTVTPTPVVNPQNGYQYAPRTTFTWAGEGDAPNCPVSYVTTLDIMSTHAAGTSSPDALEGQKNVLAVEYTINSKGRGQTCSVIVDDPEGAKAAAWKGQNPATVACGWDDVAPVQKFKGYLGEQPQITRAGGETVGRPQYKLDLQDPVDARLTCKFMLDRQAAGYEQLATWVYRLLYDAGEPASALTDILALVTGSMADIYIPGSYGAKDLAHDFESTVAVPDALDKVTGALGYSWGWNGETGQWFLRSTKQAYSGTPDWTLNVAAAAAGDYPLKIDHIRSKHEFRNYLMMIAKTSDGAETVNLWADRNSHLVAEASNFIGCDLWEVLKESDLWSALAKGQARWAELQGMPSVIKWDMKQALTTLGPGKTVKAQITYMGVATDSIYRITEERGEQPGTPSLQYTQTLTAEWVQNA